MSQVCFPTRIFYMGGIDATEEDTKKAAQTIANAARCEVEPVHNDTTPMRKVIEAITKAFVGIVLLKFACDSEKESTRKKVFSVGSAAFFTWTLMDYAKIQHEKSGAASNLADRIIDFLDENPLSHTTVVLHSQAADIGEETLGQLSDYRDRIHVITIGGKVSISDDFQVTNFTSFDDYVARTTQFFNSFQSGTRTVAWINNTGHSSKGYLRNPSVMNALESAGRKTCYNLKNARISS